MSQKSLQRQISPVQRQILPVQRQIPFPNRSLTQPRVRSNRPLPPIPTSPVQRQISPFPNRSLTQPRLRSNRPLPPIPTSQNGFSNGLNQNGFANGLNGNGFANGLNGNGFLPTQKTNGLSLNGNGFAKPIQTSSSIAIEQEKGSNSMWYIPSECIKNFGNLRIQKIIGSGVQGTVYEACENGSQGDKCDKIIKVTPLIPTEEGYIESFYKPGISYDYKRRKFEKEVKITQLASDLGVSPKIYNGFICSDIVSSNRSSEEKLHLGFIIMDRWDMTLLDYIQNFGKLLPQNLHDKLIGLLKKLHDAGVYHGDMHLENVILKVKRDDATNEPIPVDIAIIDYGLADFITPENKDFVDTDFSRVKSGIKKYARILKR